MGGGQSARVQLGEPTMGVNMQWELMGDESSRPRKFGKQEFNKGNKSSASGSLGSGSSNTMGVGRGLSDNLT